MEPGQIGAWAPWGRGPTGVLLQSQQGREAELRCGQDLLKSIKVQGTSSFPPTTTGPQHNPSGAKAGNTLEDERSRDEKQQGLLLHRQPDCLPAPPR